MPTFDTAGPTAQPSHRDRLLDTPTPPLAAASDSPAHGLWTPSKITAWLDCPHSLTLRRAVEAGTMVAPSAGFGTFAQLLMDKGLAHERDYLERLDAEGRSVHLVDGRRESETFAQWTRRVSGVLAEGHDVLYQMPLAHDGMRGVADFLVRVEQRSALGSFRYEPLDAKLARVEAKPGHVLQLCFYAEALESIQGAAPDDLHLYLGSGRTESIRLVDVLAYWRRLRAQLRRVVDSDEETSTVPVPCAHCDFCEFAGVCEARWREEDAMHFVAGIRRSETSALEAAGISTLAALAAGCDESAVELRPERLDMLRRQAAIQQRATPGEPPPWEPLGSADAAQRDRLPPPDDGDVILDFEGHPFWTPAEDLFFLFGILTRDGDDWRYEARWAHSLAEEAAMVGALVDWLGERRAVHPAMHVYHYNHTERSSLERLAAEHGVGEHALSAMVNAGVFVDVLEVVRHAVLVGAESYGLKIVELVTGFARTHDIDAGAGAVVEYDAWTRDRDASRLERIARYNEDDVRATLAVRDWLLGEPLAGTDPRAASDPDAGDEDAVDEVVATLMATGESWKVLLAHLLEYWSRERRAHTARLRASLAADDDHQLDDPDLVADLDLVGFVAPTGRQKLRRAVFTFPEQDLGPDITEKGTDLLFAGGPYGVASVGNLGVDLDAHELTVRWNDAAEEAGIIPTAMVADGWRNAKAKEEAAREVAESIATGQTGSYPAIVSLLTRELPRFVAGFEPGPDGFTTEIGDILRATASLDQSVMAIQGPPGTGKTYTGAQIIQRLVADGKRIGVTAFSHAAINNLLRECHTQQPSLRVLRQGAPAEHGELAGVTYGANRATWDTGAHDIVAGTSFFFAGARMRATPSVDVLIIDEAGQLGLADAVAAMTAARSVILLGDPLQLAHVSVATHPDDAGASALDHLLGADATMPPDRGVFLDVTRRMHSDVCSFISTQIYDGRLTAHPDCARQSVAGATGLRWIPAVHMGRSTSSPEEATIVADTVRSLIGQTWTDMTGAQRPFQAADVMVVAPYNDQVRLVRRLLDSEPVLSGARVGTVDKFQGQEAPVVLFTMATSSAADMPRTTDFLFSRNRLNVALSRARALAYVICTDDLLDARARNLEEMKLISTLCAFVDAAQTPIAAAVGSDQ